MIVVTQFLRYPHLARDPQLDTAVWLALQALEQRSPAGPPGV